MMQGMEENIHPRRRQSQYQSFYKLSPTPDRLFPLLQAYIWERDEVVRNLPTGFHVMDIFDQQLDQIINLPSAENGKIYVFTALKIHENWQHICKTADGSWEKQRLIICKEGDRSAQIATFHNKLKQRSLWSMELYTFPGQKIALCAIYNTHAKRKPGSSDMNSMLPITRPRLDEPSHQENGHTPACHNLVDQVPTGFESLFGGDSQGVGLVVDLPSSYNLVDQVPTSFESLFGGDSQGVGLVADLPSSYNLVDQVPTGFESLFGGDSQGVGLVVDLPSSYLPLHLEYIAGSFNDYGVGSSGLLDDYNQNIATETNLIKPSIETSPMSLGSHLVEHIQDIQAPLFNIDDFNFVSPSSETSCFTVDTDIQNMEACNDMIEELRAMPSCDTGAGRLSQGWQTTAF